MTILQRSDKARQLDVEARAYVDRVERDHYEGRMPHDTAAQVYRQKVCELAARYMREQSQPWIDEMTRMHALTTCIGLPPPTELIASVQAMETPWYDAVIELLGPPPPVEKP